MNSTVNGAGYTCVTVHGCINKKIGVVCAHVRVLGYACVLAQFGRCCGLCAKGRNMRNMACAIAVNSSLSVLGVVFCHVHEKTR